MMNKEKLKKKIESCKLVNASVALKAFEFCLENDEETIKQTKSLFGCLIPDPMIREEMNKVFETVLEEN